MVKKISRQLVNVKFQLEIRQQGMKMKRSGLPPIPNAPRGRQAIKTLSIASGGRLRDNLQAIDAGHGFPYVITLTYPKDWPGDWQVWKKHLHRFRVELWRLPEQQWIGGVWRLEAQKRGAPHYHVLLWGKHKFASLKSFRQWVAVLWYQVVESGDAMHLKAGIQVKEVSSGRDYYRIMGYLCKYLGKDSVHPGSQVFKNPVGRYWGIWYKNRLQAPVETIEVNEKTYDKLRRVVRKRREVREKNKAKKLKGRTDYNRKRAAQVMKPGTSEFIKSDTAVKLLHFVDPAPF